MPTKMNRVTNRGENASNELSPEESAKEFVARLNAAWREVEGRVSEIRAGTAPFINVWGRDLLSSPDSLRQRMRSNAFRGALADRAQRRASR